MEKKTKKCSECIYLDPMNTNVMRWCSVHGFYVYASSCACDRGLQKDEIF